jgi:hypothetical protein
MSERREKVEISFVLYITRPGMNDLLFAQCAESYDYALTTALS